MKSLGENAYDNLIVEIKAEFPRFKLIPKAQSSFQKLIHRALIVITFGQMRDYIDGYYTTLGQRIYTTTGWEQKPKADRYILLCHERIHMRQFRRFSWPGMTLLYLLFPLPMGLAYFRAQFEMEAYAETIRANAEIYGKERVEEPAFREYILRQFTGASYAWMWPFPKYLNRWYDSQLAKLI